MKYKADVDSNIIFEDMQDTSISYLKNLELVSIFFWEAEIYFFFQGWKINKKRKSFVAHYLKVNYQTAYRVMQEQEAYSSVWKYTSSKKARYNRKNSQYCKVHKIWKTPYIEEMNRSGVYSDYKEDIENKVFQITIVTEDETIELVYPREMAWVKYPPKKINDIILEIMKNFDTRV
ncbi:MAG: hypothetical protein V4654_10780 [Bdellovibrionota bacterium]